MNVFAKVAVAVAMAGALAVPMATPSQAASHHRHHHHAVTGQAGGMRYDNDAGYGGQSDVYTPGRGYGAYDYAPAYGNWSSSNEARCTMSPGSLGYEPCFNH